MNKLKLLAVGVFLSVNSLFAQNEDDALKYTQAFIAGTARAQGIAGAMGAVGADFSSAVINPAGLGLYRRNEFHLSAAITSYNSSASYLGNTSTDLRNNFNIPSLGLVLTKVYNDMGQDTKQGLVSLSVAAGINRVASYQTNVQFNGTNTQSSILDYYKEDANAKGNNANDIVSNFTNYANIPSAAAYYYYLLNTAATPTTYTSVKDGVLGAKFLQRQQMQIRGGANEFNLSTGINVSNLVYLGAGLIIKNAYSQTDILFDEQSKGTVPKYTSSSLRQQINSSGSGTGGRFGIIVRPLDWLKLGIAAQTPILMNMHDDYKLSLYTIYDDTSRGVDPGRYDYFDYQVTSPSKYTFSGAITSRKLGFISVDYETVDYTQMRMQADGVFFTDVNNAVTNTMKRAGNLRIGAEAKIAEFYRVRGGYAMYETPYKNTAGVDLNRYAITGGVGFILDRVFIDFAVVNSFGKQFIAPYTSSNSISAVNSYSIYNFILTGGIRF